MKKTLLAVLAALLVLCCFVGCGGKTLGGTYWVPESLTGDSYTYTNYDEFVSQTVTGPELSLYFQKDGKVVVFPVECKYTETAANTATIKEPIFGMAMYTFKNGALTDATTGAPALCENYVKVNFIPSK